MQLGYKDRERIKLAVLSCNVLDLSEALSDLDVKHTLVTAFISNRGSGPTIIQFPDWEAQVNDEYTLGRPCEPSWTTWEGNHARTLSPHDMGIKVLSLVEDSIKDREDKVKQRCLQGYRNAIYSYTQDAESLEKAMSTLQAELDLIKREMGVTP